MNTGAKSHSRDRICEQLLVIRNTVANFDLPVNGSPGMDLSLQRSWKRIAEQVKVRDSSYPCRSMCNGVAANTLTPPSQSV